MHMHTWIYKCIAHYIAKIVAEEERTEGNLDPTNYTHKIQNVPSLENWDSGL